MAVGVGEGIVGATVGSNRVAVGKGVAVAATVGAGTDVSVGVCVGAAVAVGDDVSIGAGESSCAEAWQASSITPTSMTFNNAGIRNMAITAPATSSRGARDS